MLGSRYLHARYLVLYQLSLSDKLFIFPASLLAEHFRFLRSLVRARGCVQGLEVAVSTASLSFLRGPLVRDSKFNSRWYREAESLCYLGEVQSVYVEYCLQVVGVVRSDVALHRLLRRLV